MSAVEKRTISLPGEQAAFVDAKVASGDYASVSEVVRAGLRALKERDEAVERWLRDDVAPVYDAMARDPSRALSADAVFEDVRAPQGALEGSQVKARRIVFSPEARADLIGLYDWIASQPSSAASTSRPSAERVATTSAQA